MAFRIKSLFGEIENLKHVASKDRARILTKPVDRQKDADLNSHQQSPLPASAASCLVGVKADRLAPKVLKLVSEGQSYREISLRLGLSKNTVLAIVKRDRAA